MILRAARPPLRLFAVITVLGFSVLSTIVPDSGRTYAQAPKPAVDVASPVVQTVREWD